MVHLDPGRKKLFLSDMGCLVVESFGVASAGLLRVKVPNAIRLVRVDLAAWNLLGQALVELVPVLLLEVASLPLSVIFPLLLAHDALLVLDKRLFGAGRVHVSLQDGVSDLLPGATALEGVLFVDGGDSERCLGGCLGIVRFDNPLVSVLDFKFVAPLALNSVEGLLLITMGEESSGEGVLLAGQPALAAVIDARGVAGAGDDVGRLVQLDIGAAGDETLNVQRRKGDEVVLVKFVNVENSVTNLLDVDGATERGLLRIVSLKADTMGLVPDGIGGDGRVVAVWEERRSGLSDKDLEFGIWLPDTHLTCSLTSSVSPVASFHVPRNNSPKKGFRGFFSDPSFSFLVAYCCLSVERNHFSTSMARF